MLGTGKAAGLLRCSFLNTSRSRLNNLPLISPFFALASELQEGETPVRTRMDRELDLTTRRHRLLKRSLFGLLVVMAFIALLTFGPAWLKPALSRPLTHQYLNKRGGCGSRLCLSAWWR